MTFLDKLLNRQDTVEMTPEQAVTQAQIDQLKDLQRAREKAERQAQIKEWQGKFKWVFKKSVPKGIRDPNALVVNPHLYLPNKTGKTKLF